SKTRGAGGAGIQLVGREDRLDSRPALKAGTSQWPFGGLGIDLGVDLEEDRFAFLRERAKRLQRCRELGIVLDDRPARHISERRERARAPQDQRARERRVGEPHELALPALAL